MLKKAIMVAFAPGKTLSTADLTKIRQYLGTKWGFTVSSTPTFNVSSIQPQPGSYTPPVASSFTAINAALLTTTGGSTTPLVLSMPPQVGNNNSMQVMSLTANATRTFTTLINFSIPWSNTKYNSLSGGSYNSMNGGIVLRNSNNPNNITTFGLYFQDAVSGGFRTYWTTPNGTSSGMVGSEVRTWYAVTARPIWMRVVVDTSLGAITLLSSVTGRVNEWVQLFRFPTSSILPNQIGYYLNTISLAGFNQTGLCTLPL
jgi:hypothetical protein